MYDPVHLHPGMVVLVAPGPGDWLGRGIACATASPFSHAALVAATPEGPRLVEALWHVTVSPLDKYAARGWAYTVAGITEAQIRQVIQWALSKVGTPYGAFAFWEDIRRFLGHELPRPHPLRRWTCSGLVAMSFLQAGIVLTQAPYPAPSDLGFIPLLIGPRPWGMHPFPGGASHAPSAPPSRECP